jgi:hypothetical protein
MFGQQRHPDLLTNREMWTSQVFRFKCKGLKGHGVTGLCHGYINLAALS